MSPHTPGTPAGLDRLAAVYAAAHVGITGATFCEFAEACPRHRQQLVVAAFVLTLIRRRR